MNIQKLLNWIKNKFGSKYVDFTGIKISWSFHIHKMKIRNNTNKQLVFYFGNPEDEEPEAVIKVPVGKDVDFTQLPLQDISIQED